MNKIITLFLFLVSVKGQNVIYNVEYWLWTRDNPLNPQILNCFNVSSLSSTSFRSNALTIFIAHGYQSNVQRTIPPFVEAYVKASDKPFNIFGIQWEKTAGNSNYFNAASQAISVGKAVGDYIIQLIKHNSVDSRNIRAIGHSLGAHLVGHAGRRLIQKGYSPMKRITGLDPVRPWFDISPSSNFLSRNDASLVDVIHTNGGSLINGCFGIAYSLGHVDFYPNGGTYQPGCKILSFPLLMPFEKIMNKINDACNHIRSKDFFIESIKSPDSGFKSTLCSSWLQYLHGSCKNTQFLRMGEYINSSPSIIHGSYFLKTRANIPYSY